jgi:hypothetical protein
VVNGNKDAPILPVFITGTIYPFNNKEASMRNASKKRKPRNKRATGYYSAMELVALECKKGVRYYSTERVTGDRIPDATNWRDHYNASK